MRALSRNRMRTFLTMLGIIIGVGAVIASVSIGEGATQQIDAQIQALGDNLLIVFAGSINQGGVHLGSQATKTLTAADADAIREQISSVARISPGVGVSVQIVNGNQNWNTRVNGVNADYLTIRHWPVMRGAEFGSEDVQNATDVCIIGTTVAQEIFGDDDPVGQTIRVSNIPFRVVGELVSKGLSTFGGDQDDTMMIPYTTVQKKLLGISWVQFFYISVDSPEDMHPAVKQIGDLLRQRHHLRPDADDDFIILNPSELAAAREQTLAVLELLLACIASISLIIGGIGIMNIMLVSVTERTREIGIRMAVGATELDVQRQFLSEAVVISMCGGGIGVMFGFLGSMAISIMLKWPTQVPIGAVLISVMFSALVGIFFGYYPAKKAASLDPIEALRYE
jgi:putative ABC transport system permease protein